MASATKPPADQAEVAADTDTGAPDPTTTLTLRSGLIPVSFKQMTWNDLRQVRFLTEQQKQQLLARFAGEGRLKPLMESNPPPNLAVQQNHPDWPEYSSEFELLCDYLPWIVSAVAGSNRLTTEDLYGSTDDEIQACMLEIARLNPTRVLEMPYLVRLAYEQERAKKMMVPARPN